MQTNLKIAIIRSGLSQCEVARRAKISESRLSKVIHGRVQLNAKEKAKLAKVLGCDEVRLFGQACRGGRRNS